MPYLRRSIQGTMRTLLRFRRLSMKASNTDLMRVTYVAHRFNERLCFIKPEHLPVGKRSLESTLSAFF